MSNVNDTMDSLRNVIDGVSVEDIQLDGVQMRVGNRLVRLEVVSDQPIDIEDDIRKEYRKKLNDKLSNVKDVVNKKFSEMISSVGVLKEEVKRKEQDLSRRLAEANIMPPINMNHAEQGLSVVGSRGNTDKSRLTWLVQGIYWPKFLDGKQIEPQYQKKMISSITFVIETEENRVLGVSTRMPLGLGYFSHYHQSRPDCWGNWHWPVTYETPDDIIAIAREAEGVLENINTGSLANHTPTKLPRINTLKRHLTAERQEVTVNGRSERTGVDSFSEMADVWQT